MAAESLISQSEVKAIEIISDPVRIRIMLDDTRSEILNIMKSGVYRDGILTYDMSVGEISDRIGSAPQRIYHHCDKLIEHDFIEKSREEKKKRSITTFYRRTAKAFIINYSSDNPIERLTTKTEKWVRNMLISFGIMLRDREIETLIDLITQMWQKSAVIIEKLSTKVSDSVSYRDFDRTFGFLNDLMLHNDPEIRDIKDAISNMIVPKLNKPSLGPEIENELKIRNH